MTRFSKKLNSLSLKDKLETAANYARVLADDIKAQIQNWKENEEWEE